VDAVSRGCPDAATTAALKVMLHEQLGCALLLGIF
jgi:hypothetical protein